MNFDVEKRGAVNAAGANFERDRWNHQLTPFLQLWKALHSKSDIMRRRLPTVTEAMDPVATFLVQEISYGNSLILEIHGTLETIAKCLQGTQMPTKELVELTTFLSRGETPDR